MDNLSGYSYSEVEFAKDGTGSNPVAVAPQTTDLFIMSHGWRNDADDARTLYGNFFQSFQAQAVHFELDPAKIAVVGVFWPSEKFDESLGSPAAQAAAQQGHAAGVAAGGGAAELAALNAKLETMKDFFDEPDQQQELGAAKDLTRTLESNTAARVQFVEKVRGLFTDKGTGQPPPAAHSNDADASVDFFARDPDDMMRDLRTVDEEEIPPAADVPKGTGGAADFASLYNDFKSAALRVLNYATYFEMKKRAGSVGLNGLAPLVDQLAAAHPQLGRIHLIGHSFGGRVVTATAANVHTPKLRSLTLLQAAFSHNGFSGSKNGFFRAVVADKKVAGPILVTYSQFDRANGMAYPIASRISQDKSCAFGDKTDVFGAIGRNGAQQMAPGEVQEGDLLPVEGDGAYDFSAPKIYNLNGAQFIKGHGDVTGPQIVGALLSALFPRKTS